MPAVPAECGCGLRIAVFFVGIDEALYFDENGGQDRMVRAEKVKPCEIRPGCGPGARRAVLVFIRRRHAKKT